VGAPAFGDASPVDDAAGRRLARIAHHSCYSSPGGRPITGHGIAPDVVASEPAPDAAPAAGTTASTADPPLQLALDVVKAATILQPGAPEPAPPTRIQTTAPRCSVSPA
jgi:hypothetical protein